MILGDRKDDVAVAVVLDLRERTLVSRKQNRPHVVGFVGGGVVGLYVAGKRRRCLNFGDSADIDWLGVEVGCDLNPFERLAQLLFGATSPHHPSLSLDSPHPMQHLPTRDYRRSYWTQACFVGTTAMSQRQAVSRPPLYLVRPRMFCLTVFDAMLELLSLVTTLSRLLSFIQPKMHRLMSRAQLSYRLPCVSLRNIIFLTRTVGHWLHKSIPFLCSFSSICAQHTALISPSYRIL